MTMLKTMATQHPHKDATVDTTPWHIWSDAVYAIAGVSIEEGQKYATRERVQRMFQAGEPAWMAADTVFAFVEGGRKAARECDPRAELRQALANYYGPKPPNWK